MCTRVCEGQRTACIVGFLLLRVGPGDQTGVVRDLSLLSNILLPPNSFLKEETLQEIKLQKLTSFFYLKTAGGINPHTREQKPRYLVMMSLGSAYDLCAQTQIECDYITHRSGQSGQVWLSSPGQTYKWSERSHDALLDQPLPTVPLRASL